MLQSLPRVKNPRPCRERGSVQHAAQPDAPQSASPPFARRLATTLGTREMRHIAFLLVIVLCSCSAPEPYAQVVHGVVDGNAGIRAGIPVRFVMSPASQAASCTPVAAESVTDGSGNFSLSARYVPSKIEAIDVLVMRHAVCFQIAGSWAVEWEFNTGPALKNIDLRCTQPEGGQLICVSNSDTQQGAQERRAEDSSRLSYFPVQK